MYTTDATQRWNQLLMGQQCGRAIDLSCTSARHGGNTQKHTCFGLANCDAGPRILSQKVDLTKFLYTICEFCDAGAGHDVIAAAMHVALGVNESAC